MRLGDYSTVITANTLTAQLYNTEIIRERHRHRYEVNNAYRQYLETAGMVFSGLSPNAALVEIIEYPSHPFFIACQFHPEFSSRPMRPNPLFLGFVGATVGVLQSQTSNATIDVAETKRNN
jgi:CTP synthase